MTRTSITGTLSDLGARIIPHSWHKTPCLNISRGMSLLELIVVMFILSAIVMIAMPKFAGLRSGLQDEANRVASVLRFTSDLAAARKEERGVKFDFTNSTMSYDQEGNLKTYDLESLLSVELLSRGEVKEGELVVIFSPEGLGEFMNVHLGKKDALLDVEYNPISRRVSIRPPDTEESDKDEEKRPEEMEQRAKDKK